MDDRPERITPVVQEDVTGCRIATVATWASVTYKPTKAVAARLSIQVSDSRLWSDTTPVQTLLKQYGIEAESQEQPFRSWSTLPPLALLAIGWHRKGNQAFWHWVIFRREGPVVLDSNHSLQKNVRTDFGRIKPKWFMALGSKRSL